MIIPITAAWFTGSMWYLGRLHSHGSAPPSSLATPAILHLGPAQTTTVIIADTLAMLDPTIAAFSGTDPFPVQPDLTLRFVKNTQVFEIGEEETQWFDALRAHLAAVQESTVRITGHTDGDGDPTLNERLSLQRAQMVRDHLIAMGLPAERVYAAGLGASQPIADNLTSKGKALNRRVVIHVSDGE